MSGIAIPPILGSLQDCLSDLSDNGYHVQVTEQMGGSTPHHQASGHHYYAVRIVTPNALKKAEESRRRGEATRDYFEEQMREMQNRLYNNGHFEDERFTQFKGMRTYMGENYNRRTREGVSIRDSLQFTLSYIFDSYQVDVSSVMVKFDDSKYNVVVSKNDVIGKKEPIYDTSIPNRVNGWMGAIEQKSYEGLCSCSDIQFIDICFEKLMPPDVEKFLNNYLRGNTEITKSKGTWISRLINYIF